MNRLLEILLGLERGFLSRPGEFKLQFNSSWPWAETLGNATWNVVLILAAVLLVVYVYRREAKRTWIRVVLGALRLALLLLVIALLNRPVITLTQSRVEPSVLAVMIDDSLSMRVKDVNLSPDAAAPISRMSAVDDLLSGDNAKLIDDLAKVHELRFYRFDSQALPLLAQAQTKADGAPLDPAVLQKAMQTLEPTGQTTQVAAAVKTVLQDLQGTRLAGVVVLTDGRETPQASLAANIDQLKDFGVGIYPVPVGSENPLRNVAVQSVSAQDSVFVRDIVNIKATVRATGASVGQLMTVQLKDKKTGRVILDERGRPVEKQLTPDSDQPIEVELQFAPQVEGNLDLIVDAAKQPGEVDEADNQRDLQLAVLDAKITVLYVDGYPRWEYRYLKTEMIRDKTVTISCLLTSADQSFRQEGDRPITRFPETLSELLEYDVVLFGDVDPRQFTDAQLQLVNDFVGKRGGGFGMVAGPLYSPQDWKGSPIEAVLPVDISRVESSDVTGGTIAEGFRPVLTRDGSDSGIFRFFADKQQNQKYLKDDLQPIFWYCRGVTVKPGVGLAYAEHPSDTGPDGRKAPILVVGRYGAGLTLFSAIDDSWRWRYYTGESIFNTYWVQQLRYLARSRKLGQRKITLVAQRPVYDLGEQARVLMRVLDPQLQTQLPAQLSVEVCGRQRPTGPPGGVGEAGRAVQHLHRQLYC